MLNGVFPNLLVVEGNTASTNARMRELGATPYGEFYAALLESLCLGAVTQIAHPTEDGADCLPSGTPLTDFDGIVWTGSALNCYEDRPEVAHQLEFARSAYASGVPVFGSCWGLQVFTQALGGKVRKNPKGREVGLAQGITLNEAGIFHPMMVGRPEAFCALAVHQDEIETPAPGTTILASNDVSAVQAAVIENGDCSFWGVQYHPEFNFKIMARTYLRLGALLVEEGFFQNREELEVAARTYDALDEKAHSYEGDCRVLQLPREVADPKLRRLEIINWLETKVIRTMGVPPMEIQDHARDAHATAIQTRHGAYLPHWTRDEAIYAVTFRLADSLPKHVLEQWLFEREDIVNTAKQMGRPLASHELIRLEKLHSEKIENYLDAGHGKCWLKEDNVAEIVATALQHFNGERYTLYAWCVMPNHVHVVLRPHPNYPLSEILHSWKSFSAKKANTVLGRKGEFWRQEYYDHLIRDEQDFAHAIEYVLDNPAKAGLKNWKWVACVSRA